MLSICYKSHSIYSNPGIFAHYFSEFPKNIFDICSCIHNLFLHYADTSVFNMSIPPHRYQELNKRYLYQKLQIMLGSGHRSLLKQWTPQDRLLGICRDGALLLCAILRERGVAARLRTGFVNYVIPGLYLDTVFTEYFDADQNRWILVDSRTSQPLIDYYHLTIDFNLMDIDQNHFICAATAWKQCRAKNFNPDRFGSRQKRGLLIIRNRLIQDLALLNKNEMLIWDLWGLMFEPIESQWSLMDELSDLLITHAHDAKLIQKFYESHDQLKVPNLILSDNPFCGEQWSFLRGFSC